jgi:transcription antitermination protein NusB
MANRHLSRSIALQTLFEWDFRSLSNGVVVGKSDDKTVTAETTSNILQRNVEEFAPGMGDFSFIKNIVDGVIKKQKDIDMIIEKAAPEWPIGKIAMVDRNVLRIGLFELIFGDRKEVPSKVAINEAIELAKSFGGETSGKFVNGVLGAVYKEMGEPGKDEVSTKKQKKEKKDVPYEEMPIQKLGGAVVYAMNGADMYFALVHDVFGHWTLSKGKLESDEAMIDGIKRGVKEEIGVQVDVEDELANNEYIASHPEDGKIRKQVSYFLAKAEYAPLTLGTSGGLTDAKWFNVKDLLGLNFYDDILPIVTKAIQILHKNTN